MSRTFSDFFGFYEVPFKLTPDADFFFPSRQHLEATDMLGMMLKSGEGFAVLTGEPGTGKSVTLKKFISSLSRSVVYAYILYPDLTVDEMLRALSLNFGLKIEDGISNAELQTMLREFFLEVAQKGKKAVIMIDEAQNLSYEVLEALRTLQDFNKEGEKPVSIILAGHTKLVDKLGAGELIKLRQNISLWYSLSELDKEECGSYINYRLKKSGANLPEVSRWLSRTVWRCTKGNPRLINTLMEKTIVAVYLDGEHKIKYTHLKAALNTLNLSAKDSFIKKHFQGISMVMAVICGISIGVYKIMEKRTMELGSRSVVQGIVLHDHEATSIVSGKDDIIALEAHGNVQDSPDNAETNKDISVSSIDNGINGVGHIGLTDSTHQLKTPVIVAKGIVYGTNNLNVRAEPGMTAEVITKLRYNSEIDILEEVPQWYKIILEDGSVGWVFSEYVRLTED